MKRRTLLQSMPAAAGLAGFAGVASAADCSSVSTWDATTLYSSGDRVRHPDSDGVAVLWEAALDSRNAEPSRASAYWDYVGDCGSSGGGGNQSPTASFTTNMSTPAPGESVTFDASGSSDPDGSISSYAWDFGDGATASGQTASHSYGSSGDYTVTLTVTDDSGATGTASQTVSVSSGSANTAPNASFSVSPSAPTTGESVTVDAAESSDSDGSIASYAWDFGDGATASGQTASHSYGSTGEYTITLTVTDDAGATDSNATTVTVQSSGSGVDCSGVSAYDPSATYTGGDQVTYEGSLWTAEWWTRGTAPAESENVWTLQGSCSSGGGSGNEAPTASFTVSPASPAPGEQVALDASGSSDPDGGSLSYSWSFGDGTTASGQTVAHTYDSAGDYTVTLTVSDGNGNSATDTTTLSVGSNSGTGGQRIVGYWMQWAQYDREYTPGDIPTDQVTHLQYAFMRPETDGTISGLGGTSAQKHLFPQSWHDDITTFGDISSNTDVTCLISIGGWSDSQNFSDAALTESSRQTFADECVRIVREAGVDGVDIDWEYPGGGGKEGNTVRDGDQKRYTKLIQACRDALDAAGAEDGKDYKLTAAMSADPSTVKGLEHGKLQDLFDFVSVMTFDYRGGFSNYTGHNSPIFDNPDDPSENATQWNVDYAMNYYVDELGWDPADLNMATPFYGRSFASVQPPSNGLGNGVDDGLFQNFSGTGEGSFPPDTESSGIYDYWDLSVVGTERATSQVDLSSANWETMYDDTSKAAYSYNQTDSLMISHPTPDSVQTRANWLANSDYGGTMIWALSHDTVEHHLLDALSNGLL